MVSCMDINHFPTFIVHFPEDIDQLVTDIDYSQLISIISQDIWSFRDLLPRKALYLSKTLGAKIIPPQYSPASW